MFLTPIYTQANCKVTQYQCKTIAKASDSCKNYTNEQLKYNCINHEYKSCLKKMDVKKIKNEIREIITKLARSIQSFFWILLVLESS